MNPLSDKDAKLMAHKLTSFYFAMGYTSLLGDLVGWGYDDYE